MRSEAAVAPGGARCRRSWGGKQPGARERAACPERMAVAAQDRAATHRHPAGAPPVRLIPTARWTYPLAAVGRGRHGILRPVSPTGRARPAQPQTVTALVEDIPPLRPCTYARPPGEPASQHAVLTELRHLPHVQTPVVVVLRARAPPNPWPPARRQQGAPTGCLGRPPALMDREALPARSRRWGRRADRPSGRRRP